MWKFENLKMGGVPKVWDLQLPASNFILRIFSLIIKYSLIFTTAKNPGLRFTFAAVTETITK